MQHTLGVDYNPGAHQRKTGLIVVLLLHVLIIWGLVSGLGRKAVEVIKKPIEMKIMEEIKLPPPPPPPPPPPKIEKIQEAPRVEAPPPPFVPPPDITPVNPPPAPVIQATQVEPPKAPVVIAPPPPAPAPPAPPSRVEASIACPGYAKSLQASLSGVYEKIGIEGTVTVLIRIKGNQVVDVTPQSGPREYYRAVQAAARRLTCTTGNADEVLVPLPVVFREE